MVIHKLSLTGAIWDARIFLSKRYLEKLSGVTLDNSVNYNVLTVAKSACTVDLISEMPATSNEMDL
jgi:hypothetical protein